MVLNKNEFGKLVQAYRNQRGWAQEELAERWGHSSSYISQIEGGKRKIDSASQLVRLADILDIPQEKLEIIGRGIPERKKPAGGSAEADNKVLQMLLAPGRDMVRLSWMVWIADQHPAIETTLRDLTANLDQAVIRYQGEFKKPAQQLLAYAHQMQLLWQPDQALKVYAKAEKLQPFRPLREQGSFTVDKARAYLYLGDFDQGIRLAQRGIQLASEYRSKRHIARLESTYNLLRTTPSGKDKRLNILRDALIETKQKQVDW